MSFIKNIFRFFRHDRRRGSRSEAPPVRFEASHLIFGIGNIGAEYLRTRHNVGFMVVDRCSRRCADVRPGAVNGAEAATATLSGKKVVFVKPASFVNRCGPQLAASMAAFGVPLDSCLIVVDDYNLPLGTLRFRRGGSDGGHNGLKSVIEAVGSDFPRLRIGIGPAPADRKTVDFVLGRFSEDEERNLSPVLDKAVEGILVFMNQGIEKAMSAFNGVRI